jgi:hypothetical protein
LGIRDLFKKRAEERVLGTKVLVASLNPKFAELAEADGRCYSQFYRSPTKTTFESTQELLGAIGKGYDIVHLFCDVSQEGIIADARGHEASCADLIACCLASDVKLLWLASDSNAIEYTKRFTAAAGKPLNLVLTIDRKGSQFSIFLENLLRKMSEGATMPIAWVSLSPQNSQDSRSRNAPACMFVAGRGQVMFR